MKLQSNSMKLVGYGFLIFTLMFVAPFNIQAQVADPSIEEETPAEEVEEILDEGLVLDIVAIPDFLTCMELVSEGSGDLASYTSGLHQIVGGGLMEGADNVYSFAAGNAVQCFCPPTGMGIQTNWWKTDLTVEGWTQIADGAAWNLDAGAYLAINSDFNCNPPVFPDCLTLTSGGPGDLAHFESGLHQIPGGELLEGRDDVYTLANGNAVQCFCPPDGRGIQTNWWMTDLTVDGWIQVANGTQWNLQNNAYLALNSDFDCRGADITVTKVVVNDNDGTAEADDFLLKVGQAVVTSGVVATNFNAGTYMITESEGPAGYTATFSGDCDAEGNITMAPGGSYTCTITNNDIPSVPTGANITVTKVVVNDNGGTAEADDFLLKVGQAVVTSGVVATNFNPGTYTITETGPTEGYTATFSGDCNASGEVTLIADTDLTCTITNNDIDDGVGGPPETPTNGGGGGGGGGVPAPPTGTLTVTKVVINDNTGVSLVGDFTLRVGTTVVTSGTATTFGTGTYTVTETGSTVGGYSLTYGGDCDSLGQVTIGAGQVKFCTLTNNDSAIAGAVTTVTPPAEDGLGGGEVLSAATDDTMPIGGVAAGDKSLNMTLLFLALMLISAGLVLKETKLKSV